MLGPVPTPVPTASQEALLDAVLLDAPRALAGWARWRQSNDVVTTDHDTARLFPVLCRRLLALEVDDPAMSTFKSAYRHAWAANHAQLSRGGAAVAALEEPGIPTMLLRGAALAERYYGDIALR